jgi:hypothetical protein
MFARGESDLQGGNHELAREGHNGVTYEIGNGAIRLKN